MWRMSGQSNRFLGAFSKDNFSAMGTKLHLFIVVILMVMCLSAKSQPLFVKPDTLSFKPFVWKSEVPSGCPFRQSKELTKINFLWFKSGLVEIEVVTMIDNRQDLEKIASELERLS